MADRPLGAEGRVPVADLARVLAAHAVLVDLRSPGEFALDHLPGAVSVPLFDDVERAIIGTLYRTASPRAAFGEAREFARRRIRGLVDDVARVCEWGPVEGELEERLDAMTAGGIGELEAVLACGTPPRELDVVFYCWRGGLRSRSVVAFLHALGLGGAILDGGYRSYRREVVKALGELEFPPAVVLRGLTGVGKTLVLRELERIRPGWTVDLEQLAGHRSSILGMVGLEPCTQKTFESRLLERTGRRGERLADVVVFEGESRKVGDVILPAGLWASLSGGTSIELVAPLERRVEVLVSDYLTSAERRAELRARLPFIEQRLGPVKWDGALVRMLDLGQEDELVRVLLERYYDPLYRHSERAFAPAGSFDASDPVRAARAVAEWIEARSARASQRPAGSTGCAAPESSAGA